MVPLRSPLIPAGVTLLSAPARFVVDAATLEAGPIGTAAHVAKQVGLRNRFQLARLLEHEGLPPLHVLVGWARVIGWIEDWEDRRMALSRQVLRTGSDPAVAYRLVRRLTGMPWTELRRKGSAWAWAHFLEQLDRQRLTPGTRATA
jgi:hypothetical protein